MSTGPTSMAFSLSRASARTLRRVFHPRRVKSGSPQGGPHAGPASSAPPGCDTPVASKNAFAIAASTGTDSGSPEPVGLPKRGARAHDQGALDLALRTLPVRRLQLLEGLGELLEFVLAVPGELDLARGDANLEPRQPRQAVLHPPGEGRVDRRLRARLRACARPPRGALGGAHRHPLSDDLPRQLPPLRLVRHRENGA